MESNLRSLLLTSVHTTQESVTKPYPICDDSLSSRSKQKSTRNRRFVCERYPYPIYFGAGTRAIRYSVDIAQIRAVDEQCRDEGAKMKGESKTLQDHTK